jgi:arginase family enzyme
LKFLKKEFFDKIRRITVEELMFDLETKTDSIMELSKGRDLYVSFDIDFVDPVYAPGTGYREPGGLSSKEFLYIARRISKMKNLKAIDLVEVNPSKDFNDLTLNLAKSLLNQFL